MKLGGGSGIYSGNYQLADIYATCRPYGRKSAPLTHPLRGFSITPS